MGLTLYLNRDVGGLLKRGQPVEALYRGAAFLASPFRGAPIACDDALICCLPGRYLDADGVVILHPSYLTAVRPSDRDERPTLCQAARAEKREAGIRELNGRIPDDDARAESAFEAAHAAVAGAAEDLEDFRGTVVTDDGEADLHVLAPHVREAVDLASRLAAGAALAHSGRRAEEIAAAIGGGGRPGPAA